MIFEGKELADQEISLDFNEFVNCRFVRCSLVFRGFGPARLRGCIFDDVTWSFDGPAANTVKFMTGLYHGAGQGGRQLIESTFENIRKGVDSGRTTLH